MQVGKSKGLGVISNRMSSISEGKAAEYPLLYFLPLSELRDHLSSSFVTSLAEILENRR